MTHVFHRWAVHALRVPDVGFGERGDFVAIGHGAVLLRKGVGGDVAQLHAEVRNLGILALLALEHDVARLAQPGARGEHAHAERRLAEVVAAAEQAAGCVGELARVGGERGAERRENHCGDRAVDGERRGGPGVFLAVEQHHHHTVGLRGLGVGNPGLALGLGVDGLVAQVEGDAKRLRRTQQLGAIPLQRGLAVVHRARPAHAVRAFATHKRGAQIRGVF